MILCTVSKPSCYHGGHVYYAEADGALCVRGLDVGRLNAEAYQLSGRADKQWQLHLVHFIGC